MAKSKKPQAKPQIKPQDKKVNIPAKKKGK